MVRGSSHNESHQVVGSKRSSPSFIELRASLTVILLMLSSNLTQGKLIIAKASGQLCTEHAGKSLDRERQLEILEIHLLHVKVGSLHESKATTMRDDSDMLRTVAREQKRKFQLRTDGNSYKETRSNSP